MGIPFHEQGRNVFRTLLVICRVWPIARPFLVAYLSVPLVAGVDAICAAEAEIKSLIRPGPG